MSEVADNTAQEICGSNCRNGSISRALVSETMENAKKAKLMKSQVMANLEPD